MKTNKQKLIGQFFETMAKTRHAMDKISNFCGEDKFATILKMRGLKYLNEHPKSTVSELGNALQMSSSSIAQFSDRLSDAELILREHDSKDRRIVRLVLTEKGMKENANMHKKILEKMDKVLEYVSESDLKELLRIHTKILQTLEGQNK